MGWCPLTGRICSSDCAWFGGTGCGLICALDDIAGELEGLNAALSANEEEVEQ